MKRLFFALLVAGFATSAMADSSVCVVFMVSNGSQVVTTCDAAQLSIVDTKSGMAISVMTAVQKVLQNGYKLVGCTAVSPAMTCTLTK